MRRSSFSKHALQLAAQLRVLHGKCTKCHSMRLLFEEHAAAATTSMESMDLVSQLLASSEADIHGGSRGEIIELRGKEGLNEARRESVRHFFFVDP